MSIRRVVSATTIAALAGFASAQPVVDGQFDPGTEGSFYSGTIWVNNVPTGFGDNSAGLFTGGNFGDPENVTTGIELRIPLSALALSGTETIRIAGWVNSGDRSFKSNQIVGSLPIDTPNLGGPSDFNAAPLDGTQQFVSVNLASIATLGATVDGSIGADAYAQVFLQQNYTGFGNETDGTVDGSGPNGGGSEIDAIYMAKDATNLYILVAGNLETNGNGLDLYIDTGAAGGDSTLTGASGSGGFIVDGQSGQVFDAGFAANYVLSIDTFDDDADGMTINVPRAYFGNINSGINLLGSLAGYGSANAGALTGGDAGVPSVDMAYDNSNVVGVEGNPAEPTPVSPDVDWAYGSELNNVRTYLDSANNRLYVLIAGNMQVNFNKLQLFFDVAPGGQNTLLDTNVDISFNAINNQAGIVFDAGFEPDYWMAINTGVDGGTNTDVRFTDASMLRTNGAAIDPFFGAITDFGGTFGGDVSLLDFSGPRLDQQDGTLGAIFTEFAPRLVSDELAANGVVMTGIAGLINVAFNNSNVAGVTDSSAAGAAAVNTGIEISIDLDELGWDGSQDILMAGWITNGGFDFYSNQVIGGLPDGSPNIGPRDTDGDGTPDFDFNTVAGDQFINLSNTDLPCPADLDDNGLLNFFDINIFLTAYNTGNLAVADLDGNSLLNFFDINLYLTSFNAGCP